MAPTRRCTGAQWRRMNRIVESMNPRAFHTRASRGLRTGLAAAISGGLIACAVAEEGMAAPRVRPLTGTAYETTALATENAVREQVDAPLRMEFHRRQAFRIEPAGLHVVSVAWWKEAGGDTHCVLGTRGRDGLQTFDALAGEADAPPWSCEGEPALRLTDLDRDGCPEVLAQYALRPPSGEVFTWGLVLACDKAGGRYRFDEARTARWRAALAGDGAPRTLRQAEALLKAGPPAR